MAAAKNTGEYSLKSTSMTIMPGPGGSTIIQVNLEGTATGFGTVLGTSTFVGEPAKSGTYGWCCIAYVDDGSAITVNGQGTYESTARHKWRTRGRNQLSDGSTMVVDGEIDLATRSWTGTMRP